MDILSHTFSGIAAVSCTVSFTDLKLREKGKTLVLGALAGALPDVDALSLWSKFDSSIGKWLHLPPGNEIYFSKYWYSHHAFLHSILAAVVFVLVVLVVQVYWSEQTMAALFHTSTYSKNRLLVLSGLFVAYNWHLLEDMPTPACVWGGVNYFFPSENYVGGWGKIWWWNNYDLFLIIVLCGFVNILLNIIHRFRKMAVASYSSLFTLCCVALFIYQVQTRGFDFNYTGFSPRYNEFEAKSLRIQQEILGETLFNAMQKFDNSMKLNF